MELKIVCWNARNLSETIDRPGIRGRGLELKFRLKSVVDNIQRWAPDMVFLLEAGPDAEDAARFLIAKLNGYGAVPSDETEGESYILVFKRALGNSILLHGLIGTINGYRKAWYVYTIIGTERHNMVVLHAPSPSHPLANRLDVIEDVVIAAKAIDNTSPIILMGDLNIKSNHQNDLNTRLSAQGFAFIGPKKPDGSAQDTSLRKFTTIGLGGGFETIESQPYDQFWGHGALNTSAVGMLDINVGTPDTDNFIEWINRGMTEVTQYINGNPTGRDLRNPPVIDINNELCQNYSFFKAIYGLLSSVPNSTRRLLPYWRTYDEWLVACRSIDAYATSIQLDQVITSAIASITLPTGEYNKARKVISEAYFYIGLIYNLYNFSTGGTQGEQLLRTTIFEHGISDHFPIQLGVTVAANLQLQQVGGRAVSV